MNTQSYLIDTNIIFGLEDNRTVDPAYSKFLHMAAKFKVDVFVHEASRDDIRRDDDHERRDISLSKIEKFQLLEKVKGLTNEKLEESFGRIHRQNDLVDLTLLHAISIGAADFLVTEDRDLHGRAQRHSTDLAQRVLYIADAVQLLITTYKPQEVPIHNVEEVSAHTISVEDTFFDSLRKDYPKFDNWWKKKCIAEHRPCWVVYDDSKLAGLIVRKDENEYNTDATQKCKKILKICTFKVSPEKRGIKLGELLLKQVLWFAQKNKYDLAYITAYPEQNFLIALLEFYGFQQTTEKGDGELILERTFSSVRLERKVGRSVYETDRQNYPRFVADSSVRGFVIPIMELFHDTLFPDIRNVRQLDFFPSFGERASPERPGNTIRKVYLCRAQSKLGDPGSIIFFYKSKSSEGPSQALTAVGILESFEEATSTEALMRLTGGRSVYSKQALSIFEASPNRPVKVINYLLVNYIDPPILLDELITTGIFSGHPPQSITELKGRKLQSVLGRCNFGFEI